MHANACCLCVMNYISQERSEDLIHEIAYITVFLFSFKYLIFLIPLFIDDACLLCSLAVKVSRHELDH